MLARKTDRGDLFSIYINKCLCPLELFFLTKVTGNGRWHSRGTIGRNRANLFHFLHHRRVCVPHCVWNENYYQSLRIVTCHHVCKTGSHYSFPPVFMFSLNFVLIQEAYINFMSLSIAILNFSYCAKKLDDFYRKWPSRAYNHITVVRPIRLRVSSTHVEFRLPLSVNANVLLSNTIYWLLVSRTLPPLHCSTA